MSWLVSLLGLLDKFFRFLHDQKVRQEGAQAVIVKQNVEVAKNVKVAEQIRKAVCDNYVERPSSLHDDDGFKRD